MSECGEEFSTHEGVSLSWAGFELVRVRPDGSVTIASHADRTALQMIGSQHPEERVIGHMTRLIVAGHARQQEADHARR